MGVKQNHQLQPKRSMRAALLIGVGMMAAIDEIIFHQLLSWHHFYDRSTPEIGLLTDGLLHAAELIAIVAGFFMFSDVRRQQALVPLRAWAGFFIGLGGFQLFDGIVDHKVLRLHQVRYGVDNILPYDLAWNLAGLLLLIIGLVLLRKSKAASTISSAN
ncbi:membrane protein [Pontibacter korlensis]|uniref:Membrane protein n=2 Tax=Pontibacter korlensis TaxID=400092 RepID=A0A0E3ZH29_9BACT|nr:membrane protein [Pontibacter korlensis]